jgi:hypothetical protein
VVRTVAVLALLQLGGGCLPFALPPSRTDVGLSTVQGSAGGTSGLRVQSGVHLASGASGDDLGYDVGVGLIREVSPPTANGDAVLMSREPPRGAGPRSGGYLEIARAIARSSSRRTWVGLRAEYLESQDRDVASDASVGVGARIGWELFAPVSASGGELAGCGGVAGVAHGTAAVGVFAESGARRLPDGTIAFVATAGLSLRVPTVAGFVVDLCSWMR